MKNKTSKAPQIAGLDHLYLPTRSFESAWAFWSGAAGGTVVAEWGETGHQAGMVTLGGVPLVIAQEDETTEDPELGYRVQYGRPVMHLSTPNVDKLYKDLANRGASILRGPVTTHWGKRVLTVKAGDAVVAFVESKPKKTKKRK